MIFVGDDWAEAHHDVFVMDSDGEDTMKAGACLHRFPETAASEVASRAGAGRGELSGTQNAGIGPQAKHGVRERGLP